MVSPLGRIEDRNRLQKGNGMPGRILVGTGALNGEGTDGWLCSCF
jgi:hypothetical protein